MRFVVILMMFCIIAVVTSRPANAEDNGEGEEMEYEHVNDKQDYDGEQEDEGRMNEEDYAAAGLEDPEVGANQRLQEDEKRVAVTQRHDDDTPVNIENVNQDLEAASDYEEDAEESEEQPTSNLAGLKQSRRLNGRTDNSLDSNKDPSLKLKNRDVQITQSHQSEIKPDKKVSYESKNTVNEGGDMLFECNADNAEPREKYNDAYNSNNDLVEPSDQGLYMKQHYNTMQPEHRENMLNNIHDNKYNYYRDRREIGTKSKNTADLGDVGNESNKNEPNLSTEDEEAAIKRHVKTLTAKELEELLASLSDDKRELLKKIMSDESEVGSENINKREITKKAGAAASDENSFVDSRQSEVSKLQEGNPSGDCTGENQLNTVGPEVTHKQSDSTDLNPSTKTTAILTVVSEKPVENKQELTDLVNSNSDEKCNNDASLVDSTKGQLINTEDKQTSKIETKREAIIADSDTDLQFDDRKMLDNDYKTRDYSESQDYLSQEEEMSDLVDDENQFSGTNGNSLKREANKEADLSETVKSLEDSFPNSNAYENTDPSSDANLTPLVRVKRTDADISMKKRAAFLPEARVAYFPYRAENDDEDNDEGNEFDDDGFFDRTSNLAKNNIKEKMQKLPDTDVPNNRLKTRNTKTNNLYRGKFAVANNMESDTISLGSDSDSVISGAEGVDENLMFNGACRNRRSEQASKAERSGEKLKANPNHSLRSTPSIDNEMKTVSENFLNAANAANYQENDAFGSLPRNYEGELTRYKRVRRVKQPNAQELTSSNT